MVHKRVYIIIPVFNEKEVIGAVLREIHDCGYGRIIVVDDGSTDGTKEEAERSGASVVIRHRMNRGKGAAIKTGMEAAKRCGADAVVTFDGDGQHDPKDISIMLGLLQKGYDVILGSRFIHSQQIPVMKRILNFLGNIIVWCIYGIWATDSQYGLRAYGKRALWAIDTESDRYEYDSEVLREIVRHDLKYREFPSHVRYTKYSQQKENRQNVVSAAKTMIKVFLSA